MCYVSGCGEARCHWAQVGSGRIGFWEQGPQALTRAGRVNRLSGYWLGCVLGVSFPNSTLPLFAQNLRLISQRLESTFGAEIQQALGTPIVRVPFRDHQTDLCVAEIAWIVFSVNPLIVQCPSINWIGIF